MSLSRSLVIAADLDDPAERETIAHALSALGFAGLDHVVDYGCGRGRWIFPLAGMVNRVTGIDCDANYLSAIDNFASVNHLSGRVTTTAAADLSSLPRHSVDGMISIGTLQVLGDGARWHDFFRQARAALNPGGLLLCNVPTQYMVGGHFWGGEGFTQMKILGWRAGLDRQLGWLLQWLRALGRSRIVAGQKYYAVSARAVERLASAHGFSIVEDTQSILQKTRLGEFPGYRNENPARPRYAWWLMRSY